MTESASDLVKFASEMISMKMKRFAVAVLLLAGIHPAMAGISSGWGVNQLVVVAEQQSKAVPVSVVMPADFVSMPVRILSDQKNTVLAYEETRQAVEMISKSAKENGRLRISMGVVSLSEHQGGFGISSGSWNRPAATVEIYLLVPLSTNDTIFSSAVEGARFLDGLHMPGKTRFEIGTVQLAVENPEQYRAKVLSLIAEDMKKTREAIAPQGKFDVQGLAGPVMVGQADERNVRLFLNYSLSVSDEK